MPVYLCKPGCWSTEPWKHGIQVYNEPFDISTATTGNNSSSTLITAAGADEASSHRAPPTASSDGIGQTSSDNDANNASNTTAFNSTTTRLSSNAIRRIRHAEVVLVDDVRLVYGNYWLRLRWPGSKGGFAGYICLIGSTATTPAPTSLSNPTDGENSPPIVAEDVGIDDDDPAPSTMQMQFSSENVDPEPDYFGSASSLPMKQTDESRAPSPGFYEANTNDQTVRCLRTGLAFPSSPALQLLEGYDDGLVPPVALPSEGNPVFCRICRESLHDEDDNNEEGENPLLAPCECAGSMAFVHYLCIEQWRCRSRHPEARNGLNCETCSKPYALAPPSSRPVVEEEWLEAMPPHVMQALRQPHFAWQFCAAWVRQRWLRPLAPILLSPVVALYCRARRLLKKRGVSRRRWACSLCRRRARWKCVRCLRSYYCSRQCQNVSWHIVHKHVCYKPVRFWSSVVVYTGLTLLCFPGILHDPLLYDLLLSFIPASFYVMAVLGGGFATFLKKNAAIDLRGRVLESIVVFLTTWLVWISWGLVWAFFGQPESCVGFLGEGKNSILTNFWHRFLLKYAFMYFSFWDRLAQRYQFVRTWVCVSEIGCFSHLPKAAPEHLAENGRCISDLKLVSFTWMAAGLMLVASSLWKRRRRHGRPHQD